MSSLVKGVFRSLDGDATQRIGRGHVVIGYFGSIGEPTNERRLWKPLGMGSGAGLVRVYGGEGSDGHSM